VLHLQQVQLDWSASFALMDELPNEFIGGVVVTSMLSVEQLYGHVLVSCLDREQNVNRRFKYSSRRASGEAIASTCKTLGIRMETQQ